MMDDQALGRLQAIVLEALEARRGLVARDRIDAVEMDRLAREYERRALERLREELDRVPAAPAAAGLRHRLDRMAEDLSALQAREAIAEASRRLQRDEITWQAFEDVAVLLRVAV